MHSLWGTTIVYFVVTAALLALRPEALRVVLRTRSLWPLLVASGVSNACFNWAVTIGDVTFDWEPQTPAGVDVVPTGRGTDARLERNDRIGAAERKQARRQRREHPDESRDDE